MGYQVDVELIQDFMLRAGLNRAMLATKAGRSKGTITDILGAEPKPGESLNVRHKPRRQPSEAVLSDIAKALDVHPRALLLRVVSGNEQALTSAQDAA
jgi:hypothetical protein